MPNSSLNKKSKVILSKPQKKAIVQILELNTVRRKKEFVVEELKDADGKIPSSKTMRALVEKGFLKVRPSLVNPYVVYYQWSGLEPDKLDVHRLSDKEKLQEIKRTLWNPKWDSLQTEEKLKDPLYNVYIETVIQFCIEYIIMNKKSKLTTEFVTAMETAYKYLDSLLIFNEEL